MSTGGVPKPLKELGVVVQQNNGFLAHAQYRDGKSQMNIRGPYRTEKAQAQKDLDDIRACGGLFGEDRTKGLEAMRAEARRIQERAAHEREIRHAMLPVDHQASILILMTQQLTTPTSGGKISKKAKSPSL